MSLFKKFNFKKDLTNHSLYTIGKEMFEKYSLNDKTLSRNFEKILRDHFKVAAVDSDFEIYKFRGTKRFNNLMGT